MGGTLARPLTYFASKEFKDYTAYAMIRKAGIAIALLLALAPIFALAQYTDRKAMDDLGGPKEFAARRAELAAKLKTGYVLLFAKTQEPPAAHYREDNDFYYYTGLSDPGAIMLMDVATQRTTIFEPQQSPREIQVYGANLLGMSKDQQKAFGLSRRSSLAGSGFGLWLSSSEMGSTTRFGCGSASLTSRMARASRPAAITPPSTTIRMDRICPAIATPW